MCDKYIMYVCAFIHMCVHEHEHLSMQTQQNKNKQVKTLRGHQANITMATCMGDSRVNWEDPTPPMVISLAEDGCVKAWSVNKVMLSLPPFSLPPSLFLHLYASKFGFIDLTA